MKKGEEEKDEGCTSTFIVTHVNDEYIIANALDVINNVIVTEAVVDVNPLMLQIDVALGVVASVWD